MKRIDLHCHSLCSDGADPPWKLARKGSNAKLDLMALADHDTAEGVPEFLETARRLKLPAISGIELSAAWPGTMHILGYDFDPYHEEFRRRLSELQSCRDDRNLRILERFNDLGIPMSIEEVQNEAGKGVIGRPHFARVLVRRGIVPHMKMAFAEYLSRGKPAYVLKRGFPPAECIELIQLAGGKASLAHPIQTAPLKDLPPILKELKAMGLWGLECYSGHHKPDQVKAFRELARQFDLAETAGSDYHGSNRPGYHVGVSVPDDVPPLLLWGAESRRKR